MIPDWLESVQEDVARCLCGRGSASARQLAERLGVSEASAVHYICLLAVTGRLTIDRVTLGPAAPRGEDNGVPAGGAVVRPGQPGGGPDPLCPPG